MDPNPSYPFEPELHDAGSPGAEGRCSYHGADQSCAGAAVVSFQDRDGRLQSGCSTALEELVEGGEIQPLGQGA